VGLAARAGTADLGALTRGLLTAATAAPVYRALVPGSGTGPPLVL
jgi:hypothetical protein